MRIDATVSGIAIRTVAHLRILVDHFWRTYGWHALSGTQSEAVKCDQQFSALSCSRSMQDLHCNDGERDPW